jgi:hypothetical protein
MGDEITNGGRGHFAPNKHKIPVAKLKDIIVLTVWILT